MPVMEETAFYSLNTTVSIIILHQTRDQLLPPFCFPQSVEIIFLPMLSQLLLWKNDNNTSDTLLKLIFFADNVELTKSELHPFLMRNKLEINKQQWRLFSCHGKAFSLKPFLMLTPFVQIHLQPLSAPEEITA